LLAPYFSLADAGGLYLRRAGLAGETALGQVGLFSLRGSADLAHLRASGRGYFPGELYKAGFSLTADDHGTRLAVNLNSNSDRPFFSPAETDLGFTVSRDLWTKGSHAWLWGLNYSTRRTFARGVPMPFVTYRYTSKNLVFLLPFLVRWQASRELAVTASWQPVKYFRLGVGWRPRPYFSAELEGGLTLEQYLLAGRPDKSRALYYQASFIALKPAFYLSKHLELGAALGRQLGGLYYSGTRYDDYKDVRRLHGGPTLALSAKYTF
jgi:hypothetical protein